MRIVCVLLAQFISLVLHHSSASVLFGCLSDASQMLDLLSKISDVSHLKLHLEFAVNLRCRTVDSSKCYYLYVYINLEINIKYTLITGGRGADDDRATVSEHTRAPFRPDVS